MKTTDLLTAKPMEVKDFLLRESDFAIAPDKQIYAIHQQNDAILINFCTRIHALETLVDRLEAVNGRSVR